ncbi:uncharacterized protein LOC116339960 [Contarinia nasturtii]|uniref:uncharacterized protein LOC116339960 n=1 Tax=Contarinia nasturtii TaxID=265458 RepID=UPI0012D44CF5|nr:uncharacterized protein LOC116339960 [Contarinia nasturtii]
MNSQEQWSSKKRRGKESYYLQNNPAFNLTSETQKTNIKLLKNGSKSKSMSRVKGQLVFLSNTCAFDSLVQALAGAYAYNLSYRTSIDKSKTKDRLMEIAISLTSGVNMTRIKIMRLKLLNEHFSKNVAMTFPGMIQKVLTIPSYYDTECCTKLVKKFANICLNNDVLKDDLSNIQQAIESNFIENPVCDRCKRKPKYKREFSNHIFVEVNPRESLSAETDLGRMLQHNLDKIPLSITLGGKLYQLSAAILFDPPSVLEKDIIGHYSAAIRFNKTWELFDDLRENTFSMSGDTEVTIHSALYTILKK